jgi:hypothetical protein
MPTPGHLIGGAVGTTAGLVYDVHHNCSGHDGWLSQQCTNAAGGHGYWVVAGASLGALAGLLFEGLKRFLGL